jgi:dienelactone hydrolase
MNWHPHHTRWKKRLLKQGYAVLYLDSFTARGITKKSVMRRQVCTGNLMPGYDRATDLAKVLPEIWMRSDIDESKTVLMGWSHGGWSASDFLTMVADNHSKETVEIEAGNFKAAFLFYPYCGVGTLADSGRFPSHTKVLLFHGLDDRITKARECRRQVKSLRRKGSDIEFIGFKSARHWFDNHTEMVYDRAATLEARGLIDTELDMIKSSYDDSRASDEKSSDLIQLYDGIFQ